jgi:pyrroline-5-carboxylate reductase
MLNDKRLAIIGMGTMGQALSRGMLAKGAISREAITGSVRHAETAAEREADFGFKVSTDNATIARNADVILLCVKPGGAVEAVAGLAAAGALDHDPLLVSIVAGVRTRALEEAAGRELAVVRAMPNTPCLVGHGMSVISPGRHAGDAHLEVADAVLNSLGRVLRLDEEHMDAVTGLSASGPAFVYVIIESLAEGGVMVGLPRKVATELAAQTVLGAATMVLETGRHPAALKDEVTTPAGCTISALLALEDGRLRSVLARGVQEATRSAAELG